MHVHHILAFDLIIQDASRVLVPNHGAMRAGKFHRAPISRMIIVLVHIAQEVFPCGKIHVKK